MSHPVHTPRRGFSLIELLMVVVIVGTLAAIAAPRYGASLARYRAETAIKQVQAGLSYARERAQAASEDRTVVFDPDALTFEILGETALDGAGAYVVDLSAAPYEVDEMWIDFDGQTQVTFDMYGRTEVEGWVFVRIGDNQRYVWLDVASGRPILP